MQGAGTGSELCLLASRPVSRAGALRVLHVSHGSEAPPTRHHPKTEEQ
jgi:hypothetical protein